MTIAAALKSIPLYSSSSLITPHLRTLLHNERPFILSQCFRHLPAVNKWPQKSYLQHFSSQPIEIEISAPDSPSYGERQESTLGEFLALLSHPLPYRIYMAQFPLFERIPQLQSDVLTSKVKDVLRQGEVYSTSTWIGKRSLTPLHHDPRALTNLFVQVCGRKEVRMFPPETHKIQLRIGEGTARNTSSVDVWKENLEGLEGGFEGTVEAGDGLIIPRGWWHSLRSIHEEDLCISVNWWFKLDNP